MSFTRVIAYQRNQFVRGCGSLMGICSGLIADRELNDREVHYLRDWLKANEGMTAAWPGDVLFERVQEVLADGVITHGERAHLVETLEKICGGEIEDLAKGVVNQLAFDERPLIRFPGARFCVTGDFVYGPRERVHATIEERGGVIINNINKKLNYLVVGLRGSEEWKHGSFGTKIEKAMEYKRSGVALVIAREDDWAAALKAA